MIIFVSKVTNGPLTRCSRFGLQRLNCTVRHYANEPHPKKKVNTGTAYTIGAFALAGAASIAFAAYVPEYREWMNENVPGADGFFKFIFQEEKTWDSYVDDLAHDFRGLIIGGHKDHGGVINETTKQYTLLGWTVQISNKRPKQD